MANFRDFMAEDSLFGRKLMGVDQGARQADQRQQDRAERAEKLRQGGVYPMATDQEMQQNMKDYEYQQTLRQRLLRGGGSFDPDDTMC